MQNYDLNNQDFLFFEPVKPSKKLVYSARFAVLILALLTFPLVGFLILSAGFDGPYASSVVIIFFFVSLFLIFQFIRMREGEKKRPRTIKNKDLFVSVSTRGLLIPRELILHETRRRYDNQRNLTVDIPINEITDFESFAGGKKSPRHFKVSFKSMGLRDQELSFRHSFSQEKVAKLYQALHQASGLDDKKSPFGETAQSIRKEKQMGFVWGILAITIPIALCGVFFGICSPLLFYTGVTHFILYGFLPALVVALILKTTVLKNLFKDGFGQEMPFSMLLIACWSLTTMAVGVLNYSGLSNKETRQVVITKKYRVKHDNSYSYHAQFNWEGAEKSFLYSFDESPSVRVSRKKYKQIKRNETQAKVTMGYGTLGIPVILRSKVLGTGTQSFKKSKNKNSKLNKLKVFKALMPSFTEPEEMRTVKYPNSQVRSLEPVVGGLRHGKAIYFHENGQLYGEIHWVEGKKHGVYELFRDDGTRESILSFKMGDLHGVSHWYDINDQYRFSIAYENGKKIKRFKDSKRK